MRITARAAVVTRKNIVDSYPDYLVHYGIFGQKWGVRRFQNEDGSLTEEGKKRYDKTPESERWKKSDAEHLSDEELRRRNNRLQAEQQYKQLTTKEVERERKQFKQDFKRAVLKAALITPVIAVVGVLGKNYISSHAGKISDMLSKFGKHKIAGLRTKFNMRGVVKNASKKYGKVSLNSNHYDGMYLRPGTASKNIRFGNNGIPYVAGPRNYNYRPRMNNALPKSRFWPRT